MRTSALRTALVLALAVLLGAPSGAVAATVDEPAGNADVGTRRLEPTYTVAEGGSVTLDARQDIIDRWGEGSLAWISTWQVSTDGGATFVNVPDATERVLTVEGVTLAMDGWQYRIRVAVFLAVVDLPPSVLRVTAGPPVVLGHPVDRTVTERDAVTFSAAATGATGVQWSSSTDGGTSWVWFTGEQGLSLTLDTVHLWQDGMLVRARFTGPGGVVETHPATLTVLPAAPVITEHPQDRTFGLLDTVSFTVAATGADLSVQWQRSLDGGSTFADVVGNAGQEWTYTTYFGSTGADGYVFRALVTNAAGVAVSEQARLTVVGAVRITEHPQDASVTGGERASFRAAATVWGGAEGDLSVRWQLSDDGGSTWVDAPGDTAGTWAYTTPALSLAEHERRYRAVVVNQTSTAGVATDPAVVRVTVARPDVVTHPAHQAVTEGGSVTFAAAADGPGTSVLWQYSADGTTWLAVPGASSSTSLTLDPVVLAMDGWQYRARFENAGGTRWTEPATLTVRVARPVVTEHPVDQAVLAGGSVTFSGAYGGTDAPTTVQWQVSSDGGASFADVAGGTTSALVLDDVPPAGDGRQYRVRFTNEAGSAWSDAGTLTVLRPPPPLTVRVAPRVVLVDALPGRA